MTDLTEQWKKGKLPEGAYWVEYSVSDINGVVIMEYIPEHNGFSYEESKLIKEVIAEVPDYVEWRNMVNCACEEHEANKRLIEENEELKEILERHKKATEKAQMRSCDLEIINAHLKELLKDLQSEAIDALTAIQKDCESDNFSIFNYPEVQTFYTISDKIDEVLK